MHSNSPSFCDTLAKQIQHSTLAAAVLACALALVGCGSADRGEKVTTYPVKGRVLLADGAPLTEGAVVFVPAPSDATARGAAGKLGSDGSFTLQTPNSGEGAAPGNYKIRVETSATGPNVKRGAKRKIDQKYFEEDASTLSATVEAKPNDFEFRLK